MKKLKEKVYNKINKNKDKDLGDILSGSLITFVLKISGMALSYLMIFMISKNFGSKSVGYLNIIEQLLNTLSLISVIGINVYVIRFSSKLNDANDTIGLLSLYRSVIRIVLPFSIFVALIIFLFSDTISIFLFKDKSLSFLIILSSIVLPLYSINQVSVEYIRGLKKLRWSEFIRTVNKPLLIVLLLFFFSYLNKETLPVYFFYIVIGLNSLITSIFFIAYFKKKYFQKTPLILPKEILKVSFPIFISAVSRSITLSLVVFLLAHYTDVHQNGVFAVCVKISHLISLILIVVNTISAPKFSELYWSDKISELKKTLRYSSKLIFYTSLLFTIVILIFSKSILNLFGSEYPTYYFVLIILLLGEFVNASAGSVAIFLNMTGNEKILRNISVIVMILTIIFSFFMIKYFLIYGAALSVMFNMVLFNVTCAIIVKKKLNFKTYYLPNFINRLN